MHKRGAACLFPVLHSFCFHWNSFKLMLHPYFTSKGTRDMTVDEIRNAIEHFELILKINEEAGLADPCELHRRTAINALKESLEKRTG